MSYEITLEAVRELSENAMLRPAPKRLRLTRPGEAAFNAPKPARRVDRPQSIDEMEIEIMEARYRYE